MVLFYRRNGFLSLHVYLVLTYIDVRDREYIRSLSSQFLTDKNLTKPKNPNINPT